MQVIDLLQVMPIDATHLRVSMACGVEPSEPRLLFFGRITPQALRKLRRSSWWYTCDVLSAQYTDHITGVRVLDVLVDGGLSDVDFGGGEDD